MVFDKYWFQKHQKKILWLANNPILKYWFRWVLRIQGDLKFSTRIAQIQPNNYKVYLGQFLINGELRHKAGASFRTNNKFSARLYRAFKPIWWTMHFFDWLCLDQLDYSFGFDTLTAYPEAGEGGGNTTCDGYIYRTAVDESWSTIRAGAGTTVNNTETTTYIRTAATTTTDQYSDLRRSGFTFDTSSIGAGQEVSDTTLSLYGDQKFTNFTAPADIDIVAFAPATDNQFVTSDYSNFSTTVFGSIPDASFSTGSYNVITFNASGLAQIDMEGVTGLGATLSWDTDNSASWESGKLFQYRVATADYTGTTRDPELFVTYAAEAGGAVDAIFFSHNM